MRGWGCALMLCAAMVPACSDPTFACQTDEQCRHGDVMGECVHDGMCAFPNDMCESGLEYGVHGAGPLAGQCVPPSVASGSSTTDPTSAGTSTSTSGATTSSSSTGPLDATSTSTGTTGSSTSSGTTGSTPIEVCNDADDDGDGLIDEVSENNTDCGGCRLEQRNGQAIWVCVTGLPWTEALDSCRLLGADLLSIHDPETDAYAMEQITILTQRAWIGLNDLDTEGTFVWSDGSPVDYENWAANQPDNVGDEDCTHPREQRGLWNDESCRTPLPYLCAAPHVL